MSLSAPLKSSPPSVRPSVRRERIERHFRCSQKAAAPPLNVSRHFTLCHVGQIGNCGAEFVRLRLRGRRTERTRRAKSWKFVDGRGGSIDGSRQWCPWLSCRNPVASCHLGAEFNARRCNEWPRSWRATGRDGDAMGIPKGYLMERKGFARVDGRAGAGRRGEDRQTRGDRRTTDDRRTRDDRPVSKSDTSAHLFHPPHFSQPTPQTQTNFFLGRTITTK